MKSCSLQPPMPACTGGVMLGPKKGPNGAFGARPPANGRAPFFSSVWQPTQPPALTRYAPRFASPSAEAGAGPSIVAPKSKSPAIAGLRNARSRLALLAERLMAAAAGLGGGADLGL